LGAAAARVEVSGARYRADSSPRRLELSALEVEQIHGWTVGFRAWLHADYARDLSEEKMPCAIPPSRLTFRMR